MNIDLELYDGKSFKDLLKDIVVNTETKRGQIDMVVAELKDQIATINDAIVLAPIIQMYLETSVKNDDQLVKLSGVIQRLISSQSSDEEGNYGLSDAEKEQLTKEIKTIKTEVDVPVEIKK